MKQPLPEGYRFWLYPRYRLETPVVCVEFTPRVGALMAYLIVNQKSRVTHHDLWDNLYTSDTFPNVVSVHMTILRQTLRAVGVDMLTDSKRGRPGWHFKGFCVCEPEIGLSVKDHRLVPRPTNDDEKAG